jgi:PAS domain S-box-containing protein
MKEVKQTNKKIKKSISTKRTSKRNLFISNYRIENIDKKNVYDILIRTTHNLNERVKELNCLYNISNILNVRDLQSERIYKKILDFIIPSYQYPEITAVRLLLEGKEFKTKNFKETIWKQSKHISIHGKRIGELEICYLKKCETSDEGPFLKEERHLINSIAQLLSQFIERKRTEAALQQSESRFRILIEKAPVAISLSRNGFYIYNNKMFLQMFGFKNTNELNGQPIFEQFAPQCGKEIEDLAFLRKKKTPVSDEYESIGLRKNGVQFPIYLAITRVNLIDGPASIGFYTDITERKKAEESLKESREQLKNFAAHLQTIREEERVYISRELHDNLGQSLTALRIDLYRITRKLTNEDKVNNPDNIIKQSQDMISIVDSIIQSVRTIARELRPSVLDDLGLLSAIEWQIEEFIKRSGMKCRLITSLKKIDMETTNSIGVFRIVQESLTNVLRHSQATEVIIRIIEKDNNTIIEIKDNGRGIKENDIHSTKSLGLLGMRERALLFGGEFMVKREKTHGTKIILKIPKIKI